MTRRLAPFLLLGGVILAAPGSAAAHAGPTAPVATSFVARVATKPKGAAVRVLYGDQQLAVRISPSETVVVLGLLGEPYLRIGPTGVDVNEASPTSYVNRAQPVQVPAAVLAGEPARWRHVADGHSFHWHEDRLHALALAVRSPHAGYVGPWTVPLRIDGHAERIEGGLWYAPPPTRLWLWPIAVVLGCLTALLRLRSARLDNVLLVALGLVGLAAIVAGHAEANLFARPAIAPSQVGWLAFASVFAIVATALLLSPRWRSLGGLAIAAYALTVGLTLLPTLHKGHVIIELPAPLDRLTAVIALTSGMGTLLVVLVRSPQLPHGERSETTRDPDTPARRRRER